MFEDLIKSFMIDCQSRNLSPKTLIYYHDTLKMFHRFLVNNSVDKLEEVTSSLIKTYIVECQKTLKTGGVHARLRGVRAFFGFLERDELLEKNPFNKVKLPKINQEVQKVLMYDEFKILLSMALLENNPVRDASILCLMFDTGIRASELCGIELEDVSRDRGFVLIKEAKGGKPRFVPISKDTQRYLTKYIMKERYDSKLKTLFLTRKTDGLSCNSLKSLLHRLFHRGNLKYKSPHCFRRGFSVQFIKNSGDVFSLQKILGHQTLTMSSRYAVLSHGDIGDIHRLASPVSR